MSGGSDISCLRNLRIPCAITFAIVLALMILGVASCVSWLAGPDEEQTGPAEDPAPLAAPADPGPTA